jgi:DNA repair exonuclease SbcCD ATPase subunit
MQKRVMSLIFGLLVLSAIIFGVPLRASGSSSGEATGSTANMHTVPADVEDALRRLEELNTACESSLAALRGSLVAIQEQLDAAIADLKARTARGESTANALEEAAENVLAYVRDIIRRAQGDVESLLGASEANARPAFEELDQWFREHSAEPWLSEQSKSRTAARIKGARAGYLANKSQLEKLKRELDENAKSLQLPTRPPSPPNQGI